jgi:hypothetical protein
MNKIENYLGDPGVAFFEPLKEIRAINQTLQILFHRALEGENTLGQISLCLEKNRYLLTTEFQDSKKLTNFFIFLAATFQLWPTIMALLDHPSNAKIQTGNIIFTLFEALRNHQKDVVNKIIDTQAHRLRDSYLDLALSFVSRNPDSKDLSQTKDWV